MSLAMSSSGTLSLPARSANSGNTNHAMPAGMNSTDILRGQKAVEITHNGSVYRLQATRLGKLILTK